MADARDTSRLTVILVTDVVGYSRLMEADARGTVAQISAYRKEVGDPKIAEYRRQQSGARRAGDGRGIRSGDR